LKYSREGHSLVEPHYMKTLKYHREGKLAIRELEFTLI